jgi:hypothetical protein
VRYKKGGETRAVATVYRDLESLKAELEMERTNAGRHDPEAKSTAILPRSA